MQNIALKSLLKRVNMLQLLLTKYSKQLITSLLVLIAITAIYFYWKHEVINEALTEERASKAALTLKLIAKNTEDNRKLKKEYDDDLKSSELKFSKKIVELHTELSSIKFNGMQLNANCRKVRGKTEANVLERDTAKVEELYFRAELAEESARKLTESLRVIEEGKFACKAMEEFILKHAIVE